MTTTPFSDLISRARRLERAAQFQRNEALALRGPGPSNHGGLVGSSEQQLNYFAGVGTVLLPISNATQQADLCVDAAAGEGRPLPPPAKAELSISGIDHVGNYQVDTADQPREHYGFSVNLPARLTDLTRLSEKEVHDLFGPFSPQVARSNEQIVRNVHDARVGREIFSWLIVVFAGLLSDRVHCE